MHPSHMSIVYQNGCKDLATAQGRVWLYGANASGKTNLISWR